VTALLGAIARVFVAPAARAEPVAIASAPSAAVCGPEAEGVAAVLALTLRRRGPVVVCSWASTARRAGVMPSVGARRLVASMQGRGLDAAASGRLVLVRLDEEPHVAAAEAGRAAAAAGDAPVVTAICGPRDQAFDDLLAHQDLTVIAAGDAPQELLRLGVAAFGHRAVAAVTLPAASAWLARAGLCATPAARRAIAGARA
jgi:hypothetical protein